MADAKKPVNSGPTSDIEGTTSEGGDARPQFHVNDKRFWVARGSEDSGQESQSTAPPSRMPTYIERLEEQLQEKDRLFRAHVADMRGEQDELRRRLARELEQRLELTTGNLLADFLPVLDNLDRALQSAAQQPNPAGPRADSLIARNTTHAAAPSLRAARVSTGKPRTLR